MNWNRVPSPAVKGNMLRRAASKPFCAISTTVEVEAKPWDKYMGKVAIRKRPLRPPEIVP